MLRVHIVVTFVMLFVSCMSGSTQVIAEQQNTTCENGDTVIPQDMKYEVANYSDGESPAEIVVPKLPGEPVSIAFHPDGSLYVAVAYGQDYPIKVTQAFEGSVYHVVNGETFLLVDNLHHPGGILFVDDSLYVSQLGSILRLDGVKGTSCSASSLVIKDLPFDDSHQTNGMTFHNGRIYVAQGHPVYASERSNLDLSGSIFSMLPDGSDVRVEATGFRNPYDLAFDDEGRLWASDNGPNVGYEDSVQDESDVTPDEINLVTSGENYGYPCTAEELCGVDPVFVTDKHTVPTGTVWYGDRLLVNLFTFWQVRSFDPATGEQEELYWGITYPIDIAVGPDGYLYVAEWQANRIIRFKGE